MTETGSLAYELLSQMDRMTWDRFGQIALENAAENKSQFSHGQSVAALRNADIKGDSAIVIAAGPSLKRRNPAQELLANSYDGAVIVTESAIPYCLRNGLTPDLAVTVDPGRERVIRWLGDPELTSEKLEQDDYFARQDQDDAFADQLRANEEILELMARHGKDIRIALSTTSAPVLVNRVRDIGMQVYWWNPMLDDPDDPQSVTAELQRSNKFPAINAGGNVGSACWMFADAVLQKKRVGLTGMDFSYYDGTPYSRTQYYHEARALMGDGDLAPLFPRFFNPQVKKWFFTDPAYLWYRECFLEMLEDSDCETYNCTEGGILFGANIMLTPLIEFLKIKA
jgi:hypothetical protein